MTKTSLMEIYNLLYDHYGPQHWWPGQSREEIIMGAILTQNTNWKNVEKAITNLKNANCMSIGQLHAIAPEALAELIRPAGYYNIKARRVKNFLDWLFDNYDGSLERVEELDTNRLREELLTVKGIGKETADSILLYAFGRTVFVVDTYTWRIMSRHRLVDPDIDYEELRDFFEHNLPQDEKLFNEYHGLLVRIGKEHCKTTANCTDCPLQHLPHDVPE